MNEDVKYNGFCMDFMNEEIYEALFLRFKDIDTLNIKFYDKNENEIRPNYKEKIFTMCLDDDENIMIRFLGCETSIYIFDEQIMLIDESTKGNYTGSDTQYNIVYEGILRNLKHSDLLKLIGDITECFFGALSVDMIESEAPEGKYKKYNYFKPHCYILNIHSKHINKQYREFENIRINY